jgi:hypothetical protein
VWARNEEARLGDDGIDFVTETNDSMRNQRELEVDEILEGVFCRVLTSGIVGRNRLIKRSGSTHGLQEFARVNAKRSVTASQHSLTTTQLQSQTQRDKLPFL